MHSATTREPFSSANRHQEEAKHDGKDTEEREQRNEKETRREDFMERQRAGHKSIRKGN